jgi:hypothetical protein
VRAVFRGFHHPSLAFSITSWLSPLVEVGSFPRGSVSMAFSREAFSLAGWKTVVPYLSMQSAYFVCFVI